MERGRIGACGRSFTRAPGSGGRRPIREAPSSRPSEIRPPHTTMGTVPRHMVGQRNPARGQRGGLRTEIAGWDAGTPAFLKSTRAGALASRSPRVSALQEPAKRSSPRSNSGRKDRESDAARDHSPRRLPRRRFGCHSAPDPTGAPRKTMVTGRSTECRMRPPPPFGLLERGFRISYRNPVFPAGSGRTGVGRANARRRR